MSLNMLEEGIAFWTTSSCFGTVGDKNCRYLKTKSETRKYFSLLNSLFASHAMILQLCEDIYMYIRIRLECLTAWIIQRWFSIIVVGCFKDLRRFKYRYFSHIATWKQEITNLWNRIAARPGIVPRTSCFASQELNNYTTIKIFKVH